MSDFQSTSDNFGSGTCTICRQDSGNEESMDSGSTFSSASMILGTSEALVILMTRKMPFPIKGFGNSKGGGKKTMRWSPYKEELDSSNSSSFELMPTESSSVEKESRCASPVGNLVLGGTGSSYIVPAVLSYVSSNSEKNESEPWDSDGYLYTAIISRTYCAVMFYALWYKKINRDCSCQEYKRWY